MARSCPGVGAHLDAHTPGPPLQVLLYADDLVLLSRDRSGLQSLLDALHTFCATNGLRVNVDKTEAVVFGGRPRGRRPMLYQGQPVPQSKSFRYLGITMHSTTGVRPAPTHLRASALRALWALQARCKALGNQDFALRARLFRSLVEPISVFSICIPPPGWPLRGMLPPCAPLDSTCAHQLPLPFLVNHLWRPLQGHESHETMCREAHYILIHIT